MRDKEIKELRQKLGWAIRACSNRNYLDRENLPPEVLKRKDQLIDEDVAEAMHALREFLARIPLEEVVDIWFDQIIGGLIMTFGDVETPEGQERLKRLLKLYSSWEYYDKQWLEGLRKDVDVHDPDEEFDVPAWGYEDELFPPKSKD